MNKEEFIKQKTELKEKLYKLQEDYIKANSPIPVGSKVKITTKNYEGVVRVDYGFIESYSLFCDEVQPVILKVKKDETKSLNHLYVPGLHKAKFEVCND